MTKKMIMIITLIGLIINCAINALHLILNYEGSLVALRIILIVISVIASLLIMYEMKNSFLNNKYSLMVGIFACLFACAAGGVMYILWFKNIGRASSKDLHKKKYNK